MRRDYAFFEGVEQPPRRLRWVVLPLRRVLRRLLGPVWERERALFEALDADVTEVRAAQVSSDVAVDERYRTAIEYLSERIDAVERQVRSTAALGWDHAALTRRLAALEDRLAVEPTPAAGHGDRREH